MREVRVECLRGKVAEFVSIVELVPEPRRTGLSARRARISFTSPTPKTLPYGDPQA